MKRCWAAKATSQDGGADPSCGGWRWSGGGNDFAIYREPKWRAEFVVSAGECCRPGGETTDGFAFLLTGAVLNG